MPFDPKRKTVLAIIAQNENRALQVSSEGLGRIFSDLGYVHKVINLSAPSGGPELVNILAAKEVAFAYGFAGVGSQIHLNAGANIWTAARTPFVSLWFDHPGYNYRQHIVDSPYVLNGYHVADHLEARRKYLPASSSRSLLLPFIGQIWEFMRARPFAERKRTILYAKTAFQPDVLAKDWQKYSPQLQEVLHNVAEQAKKDRNLDLCDATAAVFNRQRLSISDFDLFMGVVQEVDGYIRAWRSDRLARALLPHPTHIVGRGWNYLKGETHKAEFFPPMEFDEYSRQLLDYRIIANSNPLWRDGIHERSTTAISIGAVALTDRTFKSDHVFNGLPNYMGFEWSDDLQDVIAKALKVSDQDGGDYFAAAEKAYATTGIVNSLAYGSILEKAVEAMANELRAS